MSRFLALLIPGVILIPSLIAQDKSPEPDKKAAFEAKLKPMIAKLAKVEKITVYEGLPHQGWERDLLAKELKEKKTVKLHGWPFYAEKVTPKPADVKKLIAICSDPKTYRVYGGPKKCGGYHPDWCIEWKDGKDSYHFLICFGCGESRVYDPKKELYTDLSDDAIKELMAILKPMQKNRPKKVEKD